MDKHKQLGVTFNSKMTFDDHIQDNCKKAMNRITALKRLQGKLTRNSKLTIYISFIRPVIEFGWQFYDSSTVELLNSLERVQREALLMVTSAYKKTSHNSLLREVGIPLLSKRRHMQKIQFMYKYTNNQLPDYINQLIPNMVNDETIYNLRDKENIIVPRSKKNYFLKSFIPSSIKTWNETSLNIRQAISFDSLKLKLKSIYGNTSYSLFLCHDGKGATHHSRIRMGLSALKSHRKKYHFISDAICDSCNAKTEDPRHFLLYCPAYTAQRHLMIQELIHVAPDVMQLYLNYAQNIRQSKELVHIMLFGTGNIQDDGKIFPIVQAYIENSTRF